MLLIFLVIHFLSIFIQVRKKCCKDINKQLLKRREKMKNNTKFALQFISVEFFPHCLVRFVRDITMISFSHLLTSSLHHVNANANTISLVHFLCFQFFIGQTNSVNWHCVKKKRGKNGKTTIKDVVCT